MQTTKHPYELLIRWDQRGALSGAHVQYRYVIEDSGQVVGESVGSAEPLTLGDFPITELLNQAQASALEQVQALTAERNALAAQLAAASAQAD
jgi:hypothetical protein